MICCISSVSASVGIDIPKKGVSIFAQDEEKPQIVIAERKSAFLAGFLSALIPGVGNFYAGDKVGGSIHLGAHIGLTVWALSSLEEGESIAFAPQGIIWSILGNTVVSVITSVKAANRHNDRLRGVLVYPVVIKRGGFLVAQFRF